jgi:hypothetical protein
MYENIRGSLDVLVNIFTKNDALVGVEDFEFISGSIPVYSIQLVDLLCLLHSLRNTTRMTLTAFELEEIDLSSALGFKVPVHIPNLLYLRIYFSALIPFIDAPSLHSLEILSLNNATMKPLQIPNTFARDIATLQITGGAFGNLAIQQANHWDSVKTVIWTYDQPLVGLTMTTFLSICSVEFRGDSFLEPVFNTLLIALLQYPNACPHLHTIKGDRHPSWALLTQVMLQRNQNSNVVQLQEIWLPCLPIQPILSLVVGLLSNTSTETIPTRVDDILMRRDHHALL